MGLPFSSFKPVLQVLRAASARATRDSMAAHGVAKKPNPKTLKAGQAEQEEKEGAQKRRSQRNTGGEGRGPSPG